MRQRQENRKFKAGRKSSLTNARFQALDHLGFEWSPFDAAWNSEFNALIDFKNENGHINVPGKGTNLSQWIADQRKYRQAQKNRKKLFWCG
jgi:Helicase associated domain